MRDARWSDLVRLMVGKGAVINRVDSRVTLEMLLDSWRDSQLNRILLNEHADIDLRDSEERTALMRAAERGRLDVVSILLDLGADKDAESEEGKTALSYARENGHTEVTLRLKQSGSKEIMTEGNFVAAVQAGDAGAVKELLAAGAVLLIRVSSTM